MKIRDLKPPMQVELMRFFTTAALRRTALTLLLLLGGTVFALGLGEIVVRLVSPQQLILLRPDVWRPVDSLGWAHQPNVDTRVNTGDRTVTFVTDSNGFRVAVGGRPAGQLRVLLLGDSFMEALQVEYEQSMAGLMEQCFASRTHQSTAVWNAGVGGWDPPQYYVQAQHALSQLRFDVVVVAVFLGNDVVTRRHVFGPRTPDPRRVFRLPRNFTWREFTDAVLAPINDGLETKSHLFVFLKNRFQGLLMRFGLTALEIPTELRRDQANQPRWGVTGAILAEIDSLAATYGIPTVYALIPSIEQVEPTALQLRLQAFGVDSASLDLDQPDRLVAAELSRRGLRFVSLLHPFRDAQAHGISLYGRADPHLSAAGHRLAWSVLAPLLARTLDLPYDETSEAGEACATN